MGDTRPRRRTQEQRTAETRTALFEAAVRAISRLGYSRASNAEIADDAGVSRGAITHHFATRAAFIAEVVRWVFDREVVAYRQLQEDWGTGSRISDWPRISWEVLSRPSGIAVLEIFVASRSDPELAQLIKPVQTAIEQLAATAFLERLGAKTHDATVIRLVVWTIRGLSLGREFVENPEQILDAVDLMASLLEHAAPKGTVEELVEFRSTRG